MEKSIRVEDDTSIGARASCTGQIVSVSLGRWRVALVRARTRSYAPFSPPSSSVPPLALLSLFLTLSFSGRAPASEQRVEEDK